MDSVIRYLSLAIIAIIFVQSLTVGTSIYMQSNNIAEAGSSVQKITLPNVIRYEYYYDLAGGTGIVNGNVVIDGSTNANYFLEFSNAAKLIINNLVINVKHADFHNTNLQEYSIIHLKNIDNIVIKNLVVKIEGRLLLSQAFGFNYLYVIKGDDNCNYRVDNIQIIFTPKSIETSSGRNYAGTLILYGMGMRPITPYYYPVSSINNFEMTVSVGKNNGNNNIPIIEVDAMDIMYDIRYSGNYFHQTESPFKLNIGTLKLSAPELYVGKYRSVNIHGIDAVNVKIIVDEMYMNDIRIYNNPSQLYLSAFRMLNNPQIFYTSLGFKTLYITNIYGSAKKLDMSVFDNYLVMYNPPYEFKQFYGRMYFGKIITYNIKVDASATVGGTGILNTQSLLLLMNAYRGSSRALTSKNFNATSTWYGLLGVTYTEHRLGEGGVKNIRLIVSAIPLHPTILYYIPKDGSSLVKVNINPRERVLIRANINSRIPDPYDMMLATRHALTLVISNPYMNGGITIMVGHKVIQASAVAFSLMDGLILAHGIARFSDGRTCIALSVPSTTTGFVSNRY